MSIVHRASMGRKLCSLLVAVLVAAFLGATVAIAAPASPVGTEEQNQRARQEDQQRRQREQQKDVFLQKGRQAAQDTSLPEESPAFPIKTLVLTGDSAARFPWAQAMLDGYAGRQIGAKGIGLIAKRLTNAFIDRGYITTQIALPTDLDLSGGVLTFVLVPGRIGSFRFSQDGEAGNWQTAFPARPGDILNLRDLEQGLEQMKRLPSQDGVTMQVVPGVKSGDSDVVITLPKAKKWRLALSLDDSGVAATGKLQSFAALAVDNLFRANDLFTCALTGDGDRQGPRLGTRGGNLYYSLPWGNSTLAFSHYSSHYHQSPSDTLLWGTIESSEVGLTSLLHRDQFSKTNLEAKIIFNRYRNYMEGIGELDIQRQKTTAFQLGLSQRRYIGQGILDVTVANKIGVPWFGAQTDQTEASSRYSIWLADIAYATPVSVGKTGGRYSLALHGQCTSDNTYATEYVSIGGRFTVRGFDGEETLAASKGWYLRNELALPVNSAGTEAYIGLDCGAVYGHTATILPGKFLAGAALGLRGSFRNGSYEVFAGWPLNKPAGLTTAGTTYGFQIVYQL